MNWTLIISTIIAIAIYILILWLFGWIFGIKVFAGLITGGTYEFRKKCGWYSFAAFLVVIFFLLHNKAVNFIENLLLILAGNDSLIYQIQDNKTALLLIVPLSYLLLDFLIVAIFINKTNIQN